MTAPLWTGPDLIAALGARLDGAMPATVSGASIDTRTLRPGDVFFAIRDVRDGHDFAPNAFAAGASLAVVDEAHAPALAGKVRWPSSTIRSAPWSGRAWRAARG